MKYFFGILLVAALLVLPLSQVSAQTIPQPYQIGGKLKINGVEQTGINDKITIRITRDAAGTVPFEPAYDNTFGDVTPGYYVYRVPYYEATLQPNGAKLNDTAYIKVYFNNVRLTVLPAYFKIGDSGATRQIDLSATSGSLSAVVVTKPGSGSGTVTSVSPDSRLDCGDTCTQEFPYGSTVKLAATPDDGSVFTGWSGCSSVVEGNCVFTATGTRSIKALFTDTEAANRALLYADYGTAGIWMYDGNTWGQISFKNPENIVASGTLLYADLGASGIWMWKEGVWQLLDKRNPENIVASGTLLYADLGAYGTYVCDTVTNTWTKLSTYNPQSIVASGTLLYADFGTYGTWVYDSVTHTVTKLSTLNPEKMTEPYPLLP